MNATLSVQSKSVIPILSRLALGFVAPTVALLLFGIFLVRSRYNGAQGQIRVEAMAAMLAVFIYVLPAVVVNLIVSFVRFRSWPKFIFSILLPIACSAVAICLWAGSRS